MFRLVFFTFLLFFLAACTKVVQVPAPITESDPVEDPIFSTLDFATPQLDIGTSLAVNGNDLYVTGYTQGDLDGTNQGFDDSFLRRYNGLKIWGLQFGTRSLDQAIKVATDSNGNVYVVGHTNGPLGFQVRHKDTFLAKFSQDGQLLWGKQFGTNISDTAIDLAINSNNQIYVLSDEGANNFTVRKFNSGGSLLRTKSFTLNNRPGLTPKAMTMDSSNRVIVLTNWNNSGVGTPQGVDVRLFKYNSNLNQVWQNNYGTANDDTAYDITTDNNNNIYFTLHIDAPSKGARFVKKNANGGTIYSKILEPTTPGANTFPLSITSDNNDNIYIAGYTLGSFPSFTSAGGPDIMVFKYSSGGTRQWVTQFDKNKNKYGSADSDVANDIAVSSSVYITGYTWGNLLTGSGTSYGTSDAYVAQLNKSNGTILGVDQ